MEIKGGDGETERSKRSWLVKPSARKIHFKISSQWMHPNKMSAPQVLEVSKKEKIIDKRTPIALTGVFSMTTVKARGE